MASNKTLDEFYESLPVVVDAKADPTGQLIFSRCSEGGYKWTTAPCWLWRLAQVLFAFALGMFLRLRRWVSSE